MRITVVCVGKTRERFLQEGIRKYLRYLAPYASVSLREVREEKIEDLKDAPRVRSREGERILRSISSDAHSIALDERGRELTSHEFAVFLNDAMERGVRELTFVIGGTMGLDETVFAKVRTTLALSRWTLTHEMARVVLLEQLYRAFTIIKGRPYHY
jgi:23S rRNA (pseudouridine1915-N3)-methyltransferase